MIRIVEGVPGSGKSYMAMHYLTKFAEYDGLFDEFIVRPDVLIITNITNLRIKHLNLDHLLEKHGPLEKFFTVENFEKIQNQYKVKNIILVVDEAQKYFDSKFFDKDVFYLFQYHRHIGLDVILITQHRSTISRHLVPLCEFIVSAKPRSKGIVGTFRYDYLDTKGGKMFGQAIKKDQKVFRAYQSFVADEISKPPNVILRYVYMISAVVLVCGICWKLVFGYFEKGKKGELANQNKSSIESVSKGSVSNEPKFSQEAIQKAYQTDVLKEEPKGEKMALVTEEKAPADGMQYPSPSWRFATIEGWVTNGEKTVILVEGKRITIPSREVRRVDLTNKQCEVRG